MPNEGQGAQHKGAARLTVDAFRISWKCWGSDALAAEPPLFTP